MPNCFQLICKSDPDAGPQPFACIDNEMCESFGVIPDDIKFACNWYDHLGLLMATGTPLVKIADKARRELAVDPTMQSEKINICKIALWLDENFTDNSFYAPKSVVEGY